MNSQEHDELFYSGFNRLIGAILIRAIKDYQKDLDNQTLREWLLLDGPFYLDALRIEYQERQWRKYIYSGCPGKLKIKEPRQAGGR